MPAVYRLTPSASSTALSGRRSLYQFEQALRVQRADYADGQSKRSGRRTLTRDGADAFRWEFARSTDDGKT